MQSGSQPILGVGGVVIRDGRVLLVRRAKPPLLGQWSIPGGAVEPGETLAAAVRRELKEETALEVTVGELLEVIEWISPVGAATESSAPGKSAPRQHFVILDYACTAASGEARAGSDVSEIAWGREDEIDRYALTEAATRVIRRAFAHARTKTQG